MALREINLIPADILTRRLLQRHISFWTGCLVISLVLIFGFFFYQKHVVLAEKSAFGTLQDTHTHLGLRIQEIKRIQEELEKLDQQQSVLRTIIRGPICSQVLWKLDNIMNESTWLTLLTTDDNRKTERGASLKLSGFSFSNEELGNFLNRLTGESMFGAVVLKYAQETMLTQPDRNAGEAVKAVKFEIECELLSV
jgi:Tfp pilus assembly protein PilN